MNKKQLDKKQLVWISKDLEENCTAIGYINTYDEFPKSRFGTDTAILFKCLVDTSKFKQDVIDHGETDITIALATKNLREKKYPNLTKLEIRKKKIKLNQESY